MRARRLIPAVLVVALIVAAGVYGADRLLLARQRENYAAGHAAYLKADCRTALVHLKEADVAHLDDTVSAKAVTDTKLCEPYTAMQIKAEGKSPEIAANMYLAYLVGKPAGPLRQAARARSRALITADLDDKKLTSTFCSRREQLIDPKVLELVPADRLTARFLVECGKLWTKQKHWSEARVVLAQLQTELPKTREAKTTLDDLSKASTEAAAQSLGGDIGPLTLLRKDPGLNGRAKVNMINGSPRKLEISASGQHPAFLSVKGCAGCRIGAYDEADCERKGQKSSFTVSSGRYPFQIWFLTPNSAEDDVIAKDTVELEPNGVYEYCTWLE